MKRTLTILALILASFWACNKSSQDLNVPAPLPVEHVAQPLEIKQFNESLALQETLDLKTQEARNSLERCSLAIQRANLEHIKQKRVVTAQTSLFPIHNE